MKKVFIIGILFFYSIATFGVSLNYFYCCGKLKTVTLVSNSKENNCKGKSRKGCCDNKVVTFQLKIDQKENNTVNYHFSTPISSVDFYTTHYFNVTFPSTYLPIYLVNNHPPDYFPSRQILYCVFRI